MRAMTSGFRWSCSSHKRMRLPDMPALGLWRACGLLHHRLSEVERMQPPHRWVVFWQLTIKRSLVPSMSLELSVSFQCCARTFYLLHQTPCPQPILPCVPKRQVCGMHKLVSMPSGWYSLDSGIRKGRREEKGEYSFPSSLSSVCWLNVPPLRVPVKKPPSTT